MATVQCSWSGSPITTSWYDSCCRAVLEVTNVTLNTETKKLVVSWKMYLQDQGGGRYAFAGGYASIGGTQVAWDHGADWSWYWNYDQWSSGSVFKSGSTEFDSSSTSLSLYCKAMFNYGYSSDRWNSNTGCVDGSGTLTVTIPSYYLDLKGYLDGTESSTITGYGTVNVTVGSTTSTNVTDYYQSHVAGTSYSITNITPKTGHSYNGVYSGSTSGVISGSTVVCLNFTTNTYTIAYSANGGSGAPSSQTKTYGVNLTLSSTKPTRTGYTFLGWSQSSSATSATWASGATLSTDLSTTQGATVTIYAVWSANLYYLDLNGLLDNVATGNISGYGKADVYVGGTLVGNQVSDYYTQHAYGSTYEIKNITTIPGHTFTGNSSYSGTIPASNIAVQLPFVTNDMKININNTWKPGDTYININGTWKRASAVYLNVNGTWKQING